MLPPILVDLFAEIGTGEIAVGVNGDIQIARQGDVVLQELDFRTRTVKGDYPLVPQCGADLERLIGEPNTEATGQRLEDQITEALTHDGWLQGELREVQAVPLNRQEILATIVVQYGEQTLLQDTTLNLQEGVLS